MNNYVYYLLSGVGYNLFFLGFLVIAFLLACFRTRGWLIPFAIGIVFQMIYLLIMLRSASPYASFVMNGLIVGALLSVVFALLGALICNAIYKHRTARAKAIRQAALEAEAAKAAEAAGESSPEADGTGTGSAE